jgi:hypothetical protein
MIGCWRESYECADGLSRDWCELDSVVSAAMNLALAVSGEGGGGGTSAQPSS